MAFKVFKRSKFANFIVKYGQYSATKVLCIEISDHWPGGTRPRCQHRCMSCVQCTVDTNVYSIWYLSVTHEPCSGAVVTLVRSDWGVALGYCFSVKLWWKCEEILHCEHYYIVKIVRITATGLVQPYNMLWEQFELWGSYIFITIVESVTDFQ